MGHKNICGIERLRGGEYRRSALPTSHYLLDLRAKRESGRTSPVYPDPAMIGCAANSLGKRRRLTTNIDSVNTSLTLGNPRSLT